MHRRVFQIKFRFLYIFVTKSCFKVPASVMPNEDDWELLSLGPVQAMKSLQGSSTLHFSVLLFFHTKSIIFYDLSPDKISIRSPSLNANIAQYKNRPFHSSKKVTKLLHKADVKVDLAQSGNNRHANQCRSYDNYFNFSNCATSTLASASCRSLVTSWEL